MSNERQARLQRRWALEQQSSALRQQLVTHALAVEPMLSVADSARRGARWVQSHPWVPALVALLLALRRPRKLLHWGGRAWALWGTVRRLRARWQHWSSGGRQ